MDSMGVFLLKRSLALFMNKLAPRKKREQTWRSIFAQHLIDTAIVESDITTDGEKHRETAEYKRGIEELASRQRVSQKEAQRLSKRRKAESMRLLDMQRRQKQRAEEVRKSQNFSSSLDSPIKFKGHSVWFKIKYIPLIVYH
ncbi:hypothetical protein ACFX13_021197 [Malus domestica]